MALQTLSLVILIVSASSLPTDDVLDSRFEYEYRVIEQLVELQNKMEEMKVSDAQRDNVVSAIQQDLMDIRKMAKWFRGGSVYVRWGRTVCPENGTELVYKGFVGGSHYTYTGSAVNYLCLPEDPTWGKYNDATTTIGAFLFGAEYEFNTRGDAAWNSDFAGAHDHDVPCAVCRSRRPTMIMIPGRVDCYDSWTLEYSGLLAAGHCDHHAASEFVCLDRDIETVDGGVSNHNGKLFYLTEGRCGSLKCPPYVNGRELSCVVCTK